MSSYLSSDFFFQNCEIKNEQFTTIQTFHLITAIVYLTIMNFFFSQTPNCK